MSLIVIEPPSSGLEGEMETVEEEACTPPLSSAFDDNGITARTIIARIRVVTTGLAMYTRGGG